MAPRSPLPARLWLGLKTIMLPAGLVVAAAGLLYWLSREGEPKKKAQARAKRAVKARPSKPRAFISFAVEDERIRDLFVGQSKHPDTPWELADFSLHEPFANAWKTKTRPRIKGCDVVIVLIGEQTFQAEGALWEIQTAKELGVPVFGVHISKDDKGRLPGCLFGLPVIHWTWPGIAKQIRKATRGHR